MRFDSLSEQFIPDHVFVYIVTGSVVCYDGKKSQVLSQGESYLFRKNRLIRYYPDKTGEALAFVRICIEEPFLKEFQQKHQASLPKFDSSDSYLKLDVNELLSDFIRSLKLIYHQGEIDGAFEVVKQEELLIILLLSQPGLASILFDYGKPEKINIEAFMHRHYKFNVSVDQFAYLTGRSLSAFKRDFKTVFNETPGRWLVQKRLQEAYFLLSEENRKPSAIYLELGFETLSHFSFAFKKQFGLTPTELIDQRWQHIGNYQTVN